jgi:hypothetical protein
LNFSNLKKPLHHFSPTILKEKSLKKQHAAHRIDNKLLPAENFTQKPVHISSAKERLVPQNSSFALSPK